MSKKKRIMKCIPYRIENSSTTMWRTFQVSRWVFVFELQPNKKINKVKK